MTSAEVYDPSKNEWTLVDNGMAVPRGRELITNDASLLADGRVLFATTHNKPVSNVAEVYDPSTNKFATVKPLNHARAGSAQTLLADGRVLVAGGADDLLTAVNKGEVFDPGTNTWTDTANDLPEDHIDPVVATLPNGQALVSGGAKPPIVGGDRIGSTGSNLYDPATNTFTPTGAISSGHIYGGSAVLPDGRVLVLGGTDKVAQAGVHPIDTAETYSLATGTWTKVERMDTAWLSPAAVVVPDGRVFVCCGTEFTAAATRTQIYTPSYVPTAPRSATAVAGDASATVKWTAPASDGDNPILGYTVTASTGQQVSTPDPGTSIAVSGLANAQPVTFTVTARTSFGAGPAAEPSAPVTPAAPPVATSPGATPPGATPPGTTPGADTTAPTIKIAGLKRKQTRKALLEALKFTVEPSETAKLSITLVGSKRTKRPRYEVKLASKSFELGGTRKVALKPKRARVSRARKFSVRLRIVATDAAGNKRTVTVSINVSG